MKIPFYIELPADEYGNRGYTASQPLVIQAEPYEDELIGQCLRVIEPKDFQWPIIKHHGNWKEVSGPSRKISVAEWIVLCGQ